MASAHVMHAYIVRAMTAQHTGQPWQGDVGDSSRTFHPISGLWGAKFPKMGDFLPWTPILCHAKFDAASFILGEKSVTAQTYKQKTNKKYTTYPHLAYQHVWITRITCG